MKNNTFPNVNDKPKFPEIEVEWMNQWDKIKGLEQQLEQSKGKPEFTFQDGPPFATGTPHQGHILAGTIKDVVCRWAHQTGHQVERRFGWDCHGLPVEQEVNKMLDVHTRKQVLAMGIDKYNETCRSIVMRYSGEWRHVVKRFARWIDFDNDYKTMNPSYMESVWYVFKQIYEKGKVYRGVKVMPYSTGINTVLSNFEANLNQKEAKDPSIQVRFKVIGKDNEWLCAWTTTPWTLPSNIALCVNEELVYLKIENKAGEIFQVGEARFDQMSKEVKWNKKDFKTLEKLKGSQLVGMKQQPLFLYFEARKELDNFRVISAKQVTADSGTCIVHQAPAFGEDDFQTCKRNGLLKNDVDVPCPLDEDGLFTEEVSDFKGQYVKEADVNIIKKLKEQGNLIASSTITHSQPFCQRSETPLIYKAHSSWFIAVESVRADLLKNNLETYWVPKSVQDHRFHNWLEDARDWCFSRNRQWGNPIPIWTSDDGEEVVVVGSIKELEALSGVSGITDIHRHFIDQITIPSKQGRGVLRRIDEVFDCWFESGCVPYGLQGQPYLMDEKTHDEKFPADFIAEGLDQTRGWFQTLMVISTILKNKPPFKNLICNGLVLAHDGKKMSKSKKNYTDPMEIAEKQGVDAVRIQMMNSPVVRAEPLKFKDEGVQGIIRDVILPWYNGFRFFTQNANRYENVCKKHFTPIDLESAFKNNKLSNYLDKWMVAASDLLIKQVRDEMAGYKLQAVVPKILTFLEDLTNVQIKLNRPRLKGELKDDQDWLQGLSVLHHANMVLSKMIAAYAPQLAEHTQQTLKKCQPEGHKEVAESVHFLMIPEPLFMGTGQQQLEQQVTQVVRSVERMKEVINMGRRCREMKKLGFSQPFKTLNIIHDDPQYFEDISSLLQYVKEDANVKEVKFVQDKDLIEQKAEPDWKSLGQKLLKKMKDVKAELGKMTSDQLKQVKASTDADPAFEFQVAGCTISGQEVFIKRTYQAAALERKQPGFIVENNNDVTVALDPATDEALVEEAISRQFNSSIQKTRKNSGIHVDDFVEVFVDLDQGDARITAALEKNWDQMVLKLKSPVNNLKDKPNYCIELCSDKFEFEGGVVNQVLCAANCRVNTGKIKDDFKDKSDIIIMHLTNYGCHQLLEECEKNKLGMIEINVQANDKTEIKTFKLQRDLHFTLPQKQ